MEDLRIKLRECNYLHKKGVELCSPKYFTHLFLYPFIIGDRVATCCNEQGLKGLLKGMMQAFQALEVEATLAIRRNVVQIVSCKLQSHSQSLCTQVLAIVG